MVTFRKCFYCKEKGGFYIGNNKFKCKECNKEWDWFEEGVKINKVQKLDIIMKKYQSPAVSHEIAGLKIALKILIENNKSEAIKLLEQRIKKLNKPLEEFNPLESDTDFL